MIARYFRLTAALLAIAASTALAAGDDRIYPIPEGMARLTIVRSDDVMLNLQEAVIALNGRAVGSLTVGASLRFDLPPGIWRVAVSTRPTAEQVVLPVTLTPAVETRVHVELDPARFPAGSGVAGLPNFIRQSIDGPGDDRQALFRLREVVREIPEGDR